MTVSLKILRKINRAVDLKYSLNHDACRSMLTWQNQGNRNKRVKTVTVEMARIGEEGTDRIRLKRMGEFEVSNGQLLIQF